MGFFLECQPDSHHKKLELNALTSDHKDTAPKLPFNAQEDTGVQFQRNFNFILRRDDQKNERHAYESVDEKSLS